MRLSEIYFSFINYEKDLKLITLPSSKTNGRVVKNLKEVNEMLKELKKHKIFDQDIQRIESLGDYIKISYSEAVIPENVHTIYASVIQNIKIKLSMLYYLYEVSAPKFSNDTICFSFPETATSLIDFQNFSENITKALNQIATIPKFKGSITFKGVESGSEWFYFGLTGQDLILAVAIIVPIIKNTIIEALRGYSTLVLINAINDSTKSLNKIRNALLKKYILNEKVFNELSPEDTERVIRSCIILSDEIIKGTKIQLKLLNSSELTNNTSTEKQLKSAIEEIKLLMAAQDSNQPTNDETNNETNSDDNN